MKRGKERKEEEQREDAIGEKSGDGARSGEDGR